MRRAAASLATVFSHTSYPLRLPCNWALWEGMAKRNIYQVLHRSLNDLLFGSSQVTTELKQTAYHVIGLLIWRHPLIVFPFHSCIIDIYLFLLLDACSYRTPTEHQVHEGQDNLVSRKKDIHSKLGGWMWSLSFISAINLLVGT